MIKKDKKYKNYVSMFIESLIIMFILTCAYSLAGCSSKNIECFDGKLYNVNLDKVELVLDSDGNFKECGVKY